MVLKKSVSFRPKAAMLTPMACTRVPDLARVKDNSGYISVSFRPKAAMLTPMASTRVPDLARVKDNSGYISLSGILPVFRTRSQGYRNSRRMAVNGMVKQLCREEEVGFVDLWDSFVGKEEM